MRKWTGEGRRKGMRRWGDVRIVGEWGWCIIIGGRFRCFCVRAGFCDDACCEVVSNIF